MTERFESVIAHRYVRVVLIVFMLACLLYAVYDNTAYSQEQTPTAEPMPLVCASDDPTALPEAIPPVIPFAETANEAHVRSKPVISRPWNANSLKVLPKRTLVAVVGQLPDWSWYRIVMPDGRCGWMHRTVLHLTPTQQEQAVATSAPVAMTVVPTALPLVEHVITLQVCTDLNGSGMEACDEGEGVRNVPVSVSNLSSFEQVGPRGMTDERGVLRLTVQTPPDAELFVSAPSLPWSETITVRDGNADAIRPIVLEQPSRLPWLLP